MKLLKEIALTKIKQPEKTHRSEIDQDGINELAQSIKKRGLLQPIGLLPVGDEYEIEYGHRRFLAVTQLNWPTIPAMIEQDPTDHSLHLDRAHENLFRVDLDPLDQAKMVYDLVYENDRGADETARLISKSVVWVQARMDILNWPPDIQQAIKTKSIPLNVARHLQAMKDPEARSRLLEAAIQYGATERTVKQWIEDVSVDNYLNQQQDASVIGSSIQQSLSGTLMECQVCADQHPLTVLRHIWSCPTCIMAIRELAREVQAELARRKAEE